MTATSSELQRYKLESINTYRLLIAAHKHRLRQAAHQQTEHYPQLDSVHL